MSRKEKKPPVPTNLGQLSASLKSLARFLRIDEDLITVAAQASRLLSTKSLKYPDVPAWAERLPAGEKNDLFARLVIAEDKFLATE